MQELVDKRTQSGKLFYIGRTRHGTRYACDVRAGVMHYQEKPKENSLWLDADWLWRRLGPAVLARLDSAADSAWRWLKVGTLSAARLIKVGLHRHHGPEGVLGRTWPTGTMALWATLMLGAYLVLSYVGSPFR